jgi:hypothetical protein
MTADCQACKTTPHVALADNPTITYCADHIPSYTRVWPLRESNAVLAELQHNRTPAQAAHVLEAMKPSRS